MRFFLSALAAPIVCLTLFAQTAVPLPDKAADPAMAPCVVAGRVVTATDGKPLKSARVVLMPEHVRSRRQIYAVTSESDGSFLLKDVVPGRYQLFTAHEGFVEQHYQSNGSDGGALLYLKPGQKISNVLFRMIAAAVVTGRVINEDGEAMPRVHVVALREPSEEEIEDEETYSFRKRQLRPVGSAHTDDRGQYRIFGLKPGDYFIRVTDSFEPDGYLMMEGQNYFVQENFGSEYAPTYYPGVSQLNQAQMVSVGAGGEGQADVALQRVKTVAIKGRVIAANGPASNTLVRLEQPGIDDVDHQSLTDEKGSFELKGISPGSYVIVAYQSENNSYEASARQRVEVGSENIDLNILLGGGTNFLGRVTTAGPGAVKFDRLFLSLSPIDEDEIFSAHGRAKKDGTFEIKSVRDGDYALEVWGLEDGWYVKSVRLGADNLLEKGLQVEKGASGGRLDVLVSSETAQVDGFVSDDTGSVIGARVRLTSDPETPYNRSRARSTKADQTGHFLLTDLPPGTYRVIARPPRSYNGSSPGSEPQVLTLSEREHKTLQLKLAP